jgi:Tol biopolymer transport system component
MKTTRLLIFTIFILFVLNVNVCPLFAEAPTTPKILFTSSRDGNSDIYIMNPDGSEQVNLTKHPAVDQRAVWSPTGEQILFVSNRHDFRSRGNRDLYLMDPDGSNVRRVFRRKIEAWRTAPTWSPDGKQIAYRQLDHSGGGTSGMYILTLGEQDPEFIGKFSSPAWSPDGTEIACETAEPGREWIILMNTRTRKHERLLPKKALPWQEEPSWSATADKLAFVGNNNPLPVILDRGLHNAWRDKQTIFIVNRDGTGLKQLVEEAGQEAWAPALSPNGEEVLYTQRINEWNQIFKVDVNSGVQTQLTHIDRNSGGDWFDPAYALPVSPQPQLLTTTWGDVKK